MGRRRERNDHWILRELADLGRLAALALELDGLLWLRVALSSLRKRLHGRIATVVLVLAVALRFAPFLGAAVCSSSFSRTPAVAISRPPAAPRPAPAPDTSRGPAPDARLEGREEPASPRRGDGEGRRAFGATRWPEAIVPKSLHLPRPESFRPRVS